MILHYTDTKVLISWHWDSVTAWSWYRDTETQILHDTVITMITVLKPGIHEILYDNSYKVIHRQLCDIPCLTKHCCCCCCCCSLKTKNARENVKIVFILPLVIFYRLDTRHRACVGASCLYRYRVYHLFSFW